MEPTTYSSVEIVHTRDPDGDCYIQLFIDGTEVSIDAEISIDPGRGWTEDEWQEQRDVIAAGHYHYPRDVELTPAARSSAVEAMDLMQDSI